MVCPKVRANAAPTTTLAANWVVAMSDRRALSDRYFDWFFGLSIRPLMTLSCALAAVWALRTDFGTEPEWSTDLMVVVGGGPMLAVVLILPYYAVGVGIGFALACLDGLRGVRVDEDEVA